MIASEAAPPPGEAAPVVGDYQLMRRLGSGAMGEVWLGCHTTTGTLAALKLLRQSLKSRERVAKTFDRERRAIGRLGHPHIVALFDVGKDWLATAYVDGTDLARRLKTPIDPATAVHLTLQVASALAHAHAYGVVHRDVKPSNILLDTAGNAFLADFGLALLPEALDDEHRVGTPAYMAPEQAAGALAGPAADQYALGRTLLEMLVGGTLPLDGVEALAELPAELPAALRAVVARATAVAPSSWPRCSPPPRASTPNASSGSWPASSSAPARRWWQPSPANMRARRRPPATSYSAASSPSPTLIRWRRRASSSRRSTRSAFRAPTCGAS